VDSAAGADNNYDRIVNVTPIPTAVPAAPLPPARRSARSFDRQRTELEFSRDYPDHSL